MIIFILFGFLVIVSLTTLFVANIHGYAGAIILGVNALAIDSKSSFVASSSLLINPSIL